MNPQSAAVGMAPFLSRTLPFLVLLILAAAMSGHAHGISEADRQAMVAGGNWRFLWLGAVHMLTGYDHLLFLFGVIFYLTGLKDVFKYVTVFTIGHSITLIAATYLGITANYYLVDAVIALSVCYKAFDNLDGFKGMLGIRPPNLLAVILVFGLIHGFGLSTRLQQLPLPEHGLIWRILSFNAGVEIGQVAALAVLVLALAGLRKSTAFKPWGTVVNGLLFLAGLGLFFFQMTGYFMGDHAHDHNDEPTHNATPHRHEGQDEAHTHGEDNHGDHNPPAGPVGVQVDVLSKPDSASPTVGDSAISPLRPGHKAPHDHSHSKPHSHDGEGTHHH